MTRSGKWVTAAALLLFLIPSAYSTWLARDQPFLGGWHDDAIYLVGAKSLAEGNGYRIASLPGGPWQTKYPPLFSLYLSLAWRIAPDFPGNLPLVTLLCWLILPVWLALAWRLFRDLGLENKHALLLCAVLAVNQHVVMFGMVAMSELMASALWMASVALAIRSTNSPRMAAIAGFVGAAAFLARSATLPLLLAVPVYLLLLRQWRSIAAYVVPMFAAVAGWNIWVRAHLTGATDPTMLFYTNYFGFQLYNVHINELPIAIAKNFERLFWAIGSLVAGMGESAVDDVLSMATLMNFLGRLIAIVTIVGMIRHVRRTGVNPYHLFTGAFLLLVMVWAAPPSERFLFPLLPVLLAGFFVQMQSFGEVLRRFARPLRVGVRSIALAMLCAWCALIAVRFTTGLPKGFDVYRRLRASNVSAYQWIAANTPADARFLAYEDPMLYLYTGRTGIHRAVPTRYFYQGDSKGVHVVIESLPDFARERRLQYVLTTDNDWHGELLPNAAIFEFRRKMTELPELKQVYRSELTRVYRFDWGSMAQWTR